MEKEVDRGVPRHCGQEEPGEIHEPAGLEVVLQEEVETGKRLLNRTLSDLEPLTSCEQSFGNTVFFSSMTKSRNVAAKKMTQVIIEDGGWAHGGSTCMYKSDV